MTTIRNITINAWQFGLVSLWLSSTHLAIFSVTGQMTTIDIVTACVFLVGATVTSVATLGTFALGVRALFAPNQQ